MKSFLLGLILIASNVSYAQPGGKCPWDALNSDHTRLFDVQSCRTSYNDQSKVTITEGEGIIAITRFVIDPDQCSSVIVEFIGPDAWLLTLENAPWGDYVSEEIEFETLIGTTSLETIMWPCDLRITAELTNVRGSFKIIYRRKR